jgi:hypothetical protein
MDRKPQANAADQTQHRSPPQGERQPLFGALKGTVFVLPGVDLTEPADPDWAIVAEQASLHHSE